jgi:putative aldouronate transport system permease protein
MSAAAAKASKTNAGETFKLTKKKPNVFLEVKNNFFLYVLVLPAMAYIFMYGYLTLPYIIIAFERFNFRKGIFSPFIGLQNFKFFFGSSWAFTVTRNTVVFNFLFMLVSSASAIFLAIIINEVRVNRYIKTMQSFMLFPFFISWVVVSYMLQGLLSTDTGMINHILLSLGLERISFYQSPQYWYAILAILTVWKGAGYSSIIYIATITGFDEQIYEAALIDGASRWGRIRYITIPMLLPTVILMTLMSIGRIFSGDFGMFYALIRDNGQLMPVTEIIDTYVFRTLKTTGDPSISMAIGLYQSVVGFILVCGSNLLSRKFFPEGALF